MAFYGYLALEGMNLGPIEHGFDKFEYTNAIPITKFEHQVSIDLQKDKGGTDARNTSKSGEPQHGNIIVLKELGQSTPTIYRALCSQERMRRAEILWYRFNESGIEDLYFRLNLENAMITGVRVVQPEVRDEETQSHIINEEISISYTAITWEFTQSENLQSFTAEVIHNSR